MKHYHGISVVHHLLLEDMKEEQYRPEANTPIQLADELLLLLLRPGQIRVKDMATFVSRVFVDLLPVCSGFRARKRILLAVLAVVGPALFILRRGRPLDDSVRFLFRSRARFYRERGHFCLVIGSTN